MLFTPKYKDYYSFVIRNYIVVAITLFIVKEILLFLFGTFLHWSVLLVALLILQVYEFFARKKIIDNIEDISIAYTIPNLIPGLKYTHLMAYPKFMDEYSRVEN
jgi:hypothetical protein